VKVLASQVGLMLLVTLVAGLCCTLVAALVEGAATAIATLTATAASLIPGAAVIVYFHRASLGVNALLLGTLLRIGLTSLVGGLLALAAESLRGPAFLLTLAVVYLSNLALETWFVLEKNQQSGQFHSNH
jgi:hypothetical protein